jgi:hypothetical protein
MTERKPTQRELRTRAILQSDKKIFAIASNALAWIGSAVAILWALLFILAALTKRGDGLVVLGVAGIPVLLFWLVTGALPRLVARVTRDDP